MSGLFDWFVTGILTRTWRESIAPDPARFIALFAAPGGEVMIPQSVLEGWHDGLTDGGSDAGFVRFVTAYNPNTPQVPQIAISMEDEPDDTQPLGYAGPATDGAATFTMTLHETVAVDIHTHHQDLTRALHVVCRGILMSQSDDFVRIGYPGGARYLGGADLVPNEELMPGASQRPRVFRRMQRWMTISQPVWAGGALGTAQPHVYAADVVVADITGGVVGDVTAGV